MTINTASYIFGAAQTLCIGTKTRMYPPHHTMWYMCISSRASKAVNECFFSWWSVFGGLWVKDISKSFDGRPILKKLSLKVFPGECVGVLGPNGCGKTTLFSMCIGEQNPEGGNGQDGDFMSEAKDWAGELISGQTGTGRILVSQIRKQKAKAAHT